MTATFKKGTTIIELLVVLGIVSMVFFSINHLILLGFQTSFLGLTYTKGILLAQEGLEVMRILKTQSWQSNIASLNALTPYYPTLSGTTWSLQTSSPGLLDNLFTRFLTIENVYRDGNNNIASLGTLDNNTKKVTVTTRWQTTIGQKEIIIPAYITNTEGN